MQSRGGSIARESWVTSSSSPTLDQAPCGIASPGGIQPYSWRQDHSRTRDERWNCAHGGGHPDQPPWHRGCRPPLDGDRTPIYERGIARPTLCLTTALLPHVCRDDWHSDVDPIPSSAASNATVACFPHRYRQSKPQHLRVRRVDASTQALRRRFWTCTLPRQWRGEALSTAVLARLRAAG